MDDWKGLVGGREHVSWRPCGAWASCLSRTLLAECCPLALREPGKQALLTSPPKVCLCLGAVLGVGCDETLPYGDSIPSILPKLRTQEDGTLFKAPFHAPPGMIQA